MGRQQLADSFRAGEEGEKLVPSMSGFYQTGANIYTAEDFKHICLSPLGRGPPPDLPDACSLRVMSMGILTHLMGKHHAVLRSHYKHSVRQCVSTLILEA